MEFHHHPPHDFDNSPTRMTPPNFDAYLRNNTIGLV